MQTPQCFLLSEAKKAYKVMMESGDRDITDDVMVLERYGNRRSKMIRGSYDNIKLTTPEDMVIGESILKKYLGDE
jgi:2-C-methyl-D-erythritol 4-phosphate cytidylyltransferase